MRKHEGNNICGKCYDLIYRPRVNIDSMIKLKMYTSFSKDELNCKNIQAFIVYICFVPPIEKLCLVCFLSLTYLYFIKCCNVSILTFHHNEVEKLKKQRRVH